jgi:cytochrome c peroxidase
MAKLQRTMRQWEFLFLLTVAIPNFTVMKNALRIASMHFLMAGTIRDVRGCLRVVVMIVGFGALCIAPLTIVSCGEATGVWETRTIAEPPGFPPVPFPSTNVPSDTKIALGRILFYDPNLSITGKVSCASCHSQSLGFSDSSPVSVGVRGSIGTRNAPPIINTAYQSSWFWDGRAGTLEQQVMTALTSAGEMDSDTSVVHGYLEQSSDYRLLFRDAFGESEPISLERAVDAIATFCRTLISANSKYDQFLMGNTQVLDSNEKAGMSLFFSDRTRCASCHSGFNFSDNQYHSVALRAHYYDKGRALITGKERDIGKFKTPTLRNIALSGPYMNEGNFATLDDVIEHYNKGGNPFIYKDTSRIRPLNLTSTEKKQLRAFLHALTDEEFLQNPRFRNPVR